MPHTHTHTITTGPKHCFLLYVGKGENMVEMRMKGTFRRGQAGRSGLIKTNPWHLN